MNGPDLYAEIQPYNGKMVSENIGDQRYTLIFPNAKTALDWAHDTDKLHNVDLMASYGMVRADQEVEVRYYYYGNR